jgi:hypothetical protein
MYDIVEKYAKDPGSREVDLSRGQEVLRRALSIIHQAWAGQVEAVVDMIPWAMARLIGANATLDDARMVNQLRQVPAGKVVADEVATPQGGGDPRRDLQQEVGRVEPAVPRPQGRGGVMFAPNVTRDGVPAWGARRRGYQALSRSHDEVAAALDGEAAALGLRVLRSRARLLPSGRHLFYGLDVRQEGLPDGWDACVALLNPQDGTRRMRAYSGVVCAEGHGAALFKDPFPKRKTSRLGVSRLAEETLDAFLYASREFPKQIDQLRVAMRPGRVHDALMKALRLGRDRSKIPIATAAGVLKDYKAQRGRDAWSLLRCFGARAYAQRHANADLLDRLYDFYCELDKETRRRAFDEREEEEGYGDHVPRGEEDDRGGAGA